MSDSESGIPLKSMEVNNYSMTGPEYGTFVGHTSDEETSDFQSQSALWRSTTSNASQRSQSNNNNNHNQNNNVKYKNGQNDNAIFLNNGLNDPNIHATSTNLNNSLHLRTPSISERHTFLTMKGSKQTNIDSNSQSSLDFNKRFSRMAQNFLRKGRSDSIRTDKHTGSRYRQMKSISTVVNHNDNPLDYEKEVFTSANLFTMRPKNDSYANNLYASAMRDGISSENFEIGTEIKKRRMGQSTMTDDRIAGYSWLGKSNSWKDQVLEAAANVWHNQAIALFILALSVTIFAFIVSELVTYCWKLLDKVYFDKTISTFMVLIASVGLKLAFVFLAIFLTVFVAPQAAGSGIPELKAILSGIWIRRYLSIRVFFAKSCAIVCALGSGLPIGIEGPFIHIAAIIGRQLTKLTSFKHIDRKILLSAACACSIAVIFAAPIGGVLFSIEVTHHYYKINSYWSAFLCAVTAAVFTAIVSEVAPITLLLFHTKFGETPYKTYEFIVFGILGIMAGLLGALYVRLHALFLRFRSNELQSISFGFWNNAYILAFAVTASYVFLSFMLGEFAFRPIRMAIHDLFNADSLSMCSDCIYSDWGDNLGVFWNLFFFSLLNYVFSILFLCLDWPCGCFASVFAIGAASGRLMGEALNLIITNTSGAQLLAATYAVVGAASLVSGVTRTFSIAVIVIEMTAQVKLAVPVLLGVTIAWTIANWFSESLYDSILDLRGIPLLPVEPKYPTNLKAKPYPRPYIAWDVMCKENIATLNGITTLGEIALKLEEFDDVFLPILQGNHLIGEVSRAVLEDSLKRRGYARGTKERFGLIRKARKERKRKAREQKTRDIFENMNHGRHKNDDNDKHDERKDILTENGDLDVIESLKEEMNDEMNDNKNNGKLEVISEERHDSNNSSHSNNSNGSNLMYEKLVDDDNGSSCEEINVLDLNEDASQERICFTDDEWIEHLNLSPVQVIPHMPLTNIYVLFHVMHPDKIYVTKKNELIGVIDESTLITRERHHIHPNIN